MISSDSASVAFELLLYAKLFRSRLVMIRLRFHQPTKRAGDWPVRFVGSWRKLEIRELSSHRNLSPPMFARNGDGGGRDVKVNYAQSGDRTSGGNGCVHGIARCCVPVLFSLLLFIARNRILKLELNRAPLSVHLLIRKRGSANGMRKRCVRRASSSSSRPSVFKGRSVFSRH